MFRFIKTHIRWGLPAAVILWTFVICSFSGQTGEESSSLSMAVKLFVEGVLERLGLQVEIGQFLIRKMAHFSEYAILGGLVCLTAKAFIPKERRGLFGSCFAYPVVVAAVDEGIVQRLSAGRHPSIVDVGIDTSGALVGFFVIWLLFCLIFTKKDKKVGKNTRKK